MKKIIVLVAFVFLLVGCGGNAKHTIASAEEGHRFEITAPQAWAKADQHSLNVNASLEAKDASNDAYFMAIMEEKANFNGFEAYRQAAQIVIEQSYHVNINDLEGTPVTIDGHEGYAYTFDVAFEGINVYMQVYLIQTENYFGTLYAWTMQEHKDSQTQILREIAMSFKEIAE